MGRQMKKYIYFLVIILSLSALGACRTVKHNTTEILNRRNEINDLKERRDRAINHEVDIFAPNKFDEAEVYFEKALNEAQTSSDYDAGKRTAELGVKALAEAEQIAQDSKQFFAKLIDQRNRAQMVQAHVLFENEFAKLENELIQAAKSIEENNKQEAIEKNTTLANRYADLEVRALKATVGDLAEEAYQQAVKARADKYAPRTLKKAKEQLSLAKKMIDVDKENYKKAQVHAEAAQENALRAKNIAELVIGFEKEKASMEQIILWYQDRLAEVHKALPTILKFDKADRDSVAKFYEELRQLSADNRELEQRSVYAERKIAELSKELLSKIDDPSKKNFMEQASREESFREISKRFTPDEAEILKRGDDILIRAHGFSFLSGKSEVQKDNYSLLNKIVASISMFPNSIIEVEGHTDSTGPRSLNQKLSGERAKNIATYLIDAANIEAKRVRSVGLGAARPAFANNTPEGRAKNRRIEIVIKPTK